LGRRLSVIADLNSRRNKMLWLNGFIGQYQASRENAWRLRHAFPQKIHGSRLWSTGSGAAVQQTSKPMPRPAKSRCPLARPTIAAALVQWRISPHTRMSVATHLTNATFRMLEDFWLRLV